MKGRGPPHLLQWHKEALVSCSARTVETKDQGQNFIVQVTELHRLNDQQWQVHYAKVRARFPCLGKPKASHAVEASRRMLLKILTQTPESPEPTEVVHPPIKS